MNVQEIKETETESGIQAALDAQMKELVRKELSTRIQPILHELRDDCRGLVADLSIGDLMKKSKATNGTNGAHVTAKRRSGRKPMLNADQVADIQKRLDAEQKISQIHTETGVSRGIISNIKHKRGGYA